MATANVPISWNFALSNLGGAAEQGAGFDRYIEVRSTQPGNARWSGMDYTRLKYGVVLFLLVPPSPDLGKLGDALHDFENIPLFISDDA